MKTETFNPENFVAPERVGRPSKVIPILQLAIDAGVVFSIPVYTSAKNKVKGSEQVQSSRIISIMREIAPKWSYAYNEGKTLELVLVPPKTKVPFADKLKALST